MRSVRLQSAMVRLTATEPFLNDMELILDFRADAGLSCSNFSVMGLSLLLGSVLRVERSWPHAISPICRYFRRAFHALVSGVAERSLLVTVQQRVRLRHVRDIASRADGVMHQARRHINTNLGFHPEVPVVARLQLASDRACRPCYPTTGARRSALCRWCSSRASSGPFRSDVR